MSTAFMFLVAVLPLLGPYALYSEGIAIVDVIIATLFVINITYKNYITTYRLLLYLFLFLIAESLLSMTLSSSENINIILAIKVSISYGLYLFTYGFVWEKFNKNLFYRYVLNIGIVCAVLAILQFTFVKLGYSGFYSGRLPLPLNQYSDFGALIDTVGTLRVHSFFEEPSYLAIYELPIFAYCLVERKYFYSFLIALSCILSGSMLGVLGLVIIALTTVLTSDIQSKKKIHLCLAILLLIIIIFTLYFTNDNFKYIIDYYFYRYNVLDRELLRNDSSVYQRLFGNIHYYSLYNFIQKLFGVGVNQYGIFFGLPNDYSNDFVCTLMNFGLIGLVALIIFLVRFSKMIKPIAYPQLIFLFLF